jgi:hypothetical protein
MRHSLRRQLWLLRAYVVVSALAFVALSSAAFRQASKPQNLGEITVERINVVDANGTLRMVISNKDRMHPGVIDGKVLDRPRPEAGLIFFNDQGDENGGLTYKGSEKDGTRQAGSALNLDQFKQDQTIGMGYQELNGRRRAALRVWDRPDVSLRILVDALEAANRIQDPARRAAAVAEVEKRAPPAPQRVFVGKDFDRSARVSLADANGKVRLNLTVDATGNPRIEFLDENGRVTGRLPQAK